MNSETMTRYDTKLFSYADGFQIRRYKRPVRLMSEDEKERRRKLRERKKLQEAAWKDSLLLADELEGSQISLDDYLLESSQGALSLDDLKTEHVFAPKKDTDRSVKVSVNRSVNHIYQLARANRWQYFFTLTFNPKIVDSTDYALTSKMFSWWINNTKKIFSPEMKYLFVPEFHKDKKKYHFHGLVSDIGMLPLVPSGHLTKSGSVIYNIRSFYMGFSTATEIRDSAKACSYIVKYLTKELFCTSRGKKRYWASRNLTKPGVEVFRLSPEEFADVLASDYNMNHLATQKTVELYIDRPDYRGKPFNKISYFEFDD